MSIAYPNDYLENAFRRYLVEFVGEPQKDWQTSRYRSSSELTGALISAFDRLANPKDDDELARGFIATYNEVCANSIREEWSNVSSLRYTHVDRPAAESLFFYVVVDQVIRDLFGKKADAVFAVLESERKVLYLYFHHFLEKVWRCSGAAEKVYGARCVTGVFGHTELSVYETIGMLNFRFSDATDKLCSFVFSAYSTKHPSKSTNCVDYAEEAPDCYDATIRRCNVDIITALEMIREVESCFNLDDFCPCPATVDAIPFGA